MKRDFTYIDDIVEGVVRIAERPAMATAGFDTAQPDPAASWAPYRIYNIGNHQPVDLMAFIEAIEEALGKQAKKRLLPLQAGDVPATYADTADLAKATGFAPATPVREGVRRFIDWYREYYKVA
jgi:UDP-glucuronate 4-epimerase